MTIPVVFVLTCVCIRAFFLSGKIMTCVPASHWVPAGRADTLGDGGKSWSHSGWSSSFTIYCMCGLVKSVWCVNKYNWLALSLSLFSKAILFFGGPSVSTVDELSCALLWAVVDEVSPLLLLPASDSWPATSLGIPCLTNTVGTASGFNLLLFFRPICSASIESTSKQSASKCSLHKTLVSVALHRSLVLWTCYSHFRLSSGSLGNLCMLILSLWVLEHPAATQRLPIVPQNLQVFAFVRCSAQKLDSVSRPRVLTLDVT